MSSNIYKFKKKKKETATSKQTKNTKRKEPEKEDNQEKKTTTRKSNAHIQLVYFTLICNIQSFTSTLLSICGFIFVFFKRECLFHNMLC